MIMSTINLSLHDQPTWLAKNAIIVRDLSHLPRDELVCRLIGHFQGGIAPKARSDSAQGSARPVALQDPPVARPVWS